MLDVKIGHTALTWNVFADPAQLETAIRDCAELGFAGTETGGVIYDWWERERPGRLREILEQNDVRLVTLFISGEWQDQRAGATMLSNAERWASAVASLGGEMLMLVPGQRRDSPPYSLDEFKQMALTLNRAGEVARDHGIRATLHPHWGTAAETRIEIELLLSLLDHELVGFAPDTGQIAKGGADPMPIIERWADIVRYVHMKDLSPRWEEMHRSGVPLRSPEGYVEMGQGVIDFPRLLEILDAVGYSGWLMSELDEAGRPPREAAQLSKSYIEERLSLPVTPLSPHGRKQLN